MGEAEEEGAGDASIWRDHSGLSTTRLYQESAPVE